MTDQEFAIVVEMHRPNLVVACRALWPGLDAEDVVQSTLERIWRTGAYQRYDVEPDAERAPAWLRKAVRDNTARAWHRDLKTRRQLDLIDQRTEAARRDVGEVWHESTDGTRTAELTAKPDALESVVRDAGQADIYRKLDAITADEEPWVRRVLEVRYLNGCTWAETACGTGIPPRALEARFRRALPRLQAKARAVGLVPVRENAGPRSKWARSRTRTPERRSFANHPGLVRPAFPTQTLNTAGRGFPPVQRQEAA